MDGFKWIVVATEMVQDSLEIKEQFEKGLLLNPVHVIKNGEELLAYLRGAGIYANRQKFPLPKVLILDLQLPDRGAWDVLEYLSSHPGLIEEVRTIVLTAPGHEKEVERAYELGAKSYLFKPFSFADFLQRSRILGVNWVLIGSRG